MRFDAVGVGLSAALWIAMVAVIALVGGAMLYDEQREFEAAVLALQEEQVALATAIAADFEGRLKSLDEATLNSSEAVAAALPRLLGGATELQQERSRVILVAAPEGNRLLNAQGRAIQSEKLNQLLRSGAGRATLPRSEGPAVGLPERLVVASIRYVHTRPGRRWGIVVLASGERLRARERHAQYRFLLGLALVTVTAGGFGGLALRLQRRQLAVARELEIAALQRERERLLAKSDKMATLAALSSGVAHQLATPLGTITARVEQVLPAVAHDARAASALRVVHEQVQRIQYTIRGLLDLARSNPPSLLSTPPHDVVRAAVAAVAHRFERQRVRVELSLEADLPPISCDSPVLEQALVNLLLNALEVSEEGEAVQLRAERRDAALLISVEDEGHGITDEAVVRAGEPFYTTKAGGRGTGLGLAIAQEIVASHGGKLTLERRSDTRGTRACIELPFS